MAEIARWSGHRFEVSASVIRSFTELQIKGSCETEQNENGDRYEQRKGSLPTEVSFSVKLNAMFGVDVRNEAMAFVDEAAAGRSDYIYVGSYKLVPCRLMLTEATVMEVMLAPNGTWISASVMLVLKQCKIESGSSATPSAIASKAYKAGFLKSTAPTEMIIDSARAYSATL